MLTKVKLLLTIGGVIAIVLLIAAFCYGYQKVISLSEQNALLTSELKNTNDILAAEIERSTKIAESTMRLEENDNARARQMQQFSGRLNNLAKDNASLREVLDVIIPDELVLGLRSFPARESE